MSKTSGRNYFRSVKRCMAWALRQGLIGENPITFLEVPGAERRETTVTPVEFELLLATIPDPAFRDLVITTLETGCRPQESLRVEARHVDLARQRWVFPKSEAIPCKTEANCPRPTS